MVEPGRPFVVGQVGTACAKQWHVTRGREAVGREHSRAERLVHWAEARVGSEQIPGALPAAVHARGRRGSEGFSAFARGCKQPVAGRRKRWQATALQKIAVASHREPKVRQGEVGTSQDQGADVILEHPLGP
jgi:hypothetical protein